MDNLYELDFVVVDNILRYIIAVLCPMSILDELIIKPLCQIKLISKVRFHDSILF